MFYVFSCTFVCSFYLVQSSENHLVLCKAVTCCSRWPNQTILNDTLCQSSGSCPAAEHRRVWWHRKSGLFSAALCSAVFALSCISSRVWQTGLSAAAHRDATVSASSCHLRPFVQTFASRLNYFTFSAVHSEEQIWKTTKVRHWHYSFYRVPFPATLHQDAFCKHEGLFSFAR